MPRPPAKYWLERQRRVEMILPLLRKTYPRSACSLTHASPLQLTIATILSAQCTDERVNQVTPALYARYPAAADLARAELPELEKLIQSTGFFRNKARNLRDMARALIERHAGQVPRTMELLVALPGVGRKTANVVLGNAFGIDLGVVVDTHVARLSGRLDLTSHQNPVKIEQDLMRLVPPRHWTLWPHLMIDHGRAICQARKPDCPRCPLLPHCPEGTRRMANPAAAKQSQTSPSDTRG